MAEQSPRTSDRSNKGVPPKRFVDMEKNSAAAVVTGSQQLSTNAQPGGSKTQPQPPQVNILRLVADMQKEMMTQIGAVHTNLQSLIVAQTEETATNIATLKQQILLVSQCRSQWAIEFYKGYWFRRTTQWALNFQWSTFRSFRK